ncbi:PREDICTED: uncharacterized protein LOC107086655 [Cyprinodon variegatus]|uniref:Uncharacterized LOC107086655 n=1 Tax=Cyprinodon variegatus TaxID=28743 RepID=A0A3Q2C9E9_CYPVA|nr:PREDICTED: uncharacterized protein LOC107086655 [Cyprinodon variegatus]
MLPAMSSSLENSQTGRLLAILEEWDKSSDQHTDNTKMYFLLLFIKFGLETVVLYACNPKKYKYFLSVFGLSIVLADFLLACLMGAALVLGAEKSLASPCFLLANASTAYGALPLPIMLLGFVDYCLDDILMSNHSVFWKTLRNVILTLLVWVVAVNYSFHSSYVEPVELESMTGKVLVCEVTESSLISAFILGLFTLSLLTLVPFWLRAPQWVREVDESLEAREKQRNVGSDLFLISIWNPKPLINARLEEHLDNRLMNLSLWLTKLLRFLFFWTPHLVMSACCMIFGFGLPAYLGFNLLWLECSNGLLVGLVFWAKCNTKGAYSSLPENVFLWHVYWDLSRDIQPVLPVAVLNPSCKKKNISLNV